MRLRRRDTVPTLSPHRLASLLPVVLAGDHLRRPRRLSSPSPLRFAALRSGCRSTAGAQIITRENSMHRILGWCDHKPAVTNAEICP